MNQQSGCLLCGEELEYKKQNITAKCDICHKEFKTNVLCKNGHFICDTCHSTDAIDFAYNYCLHSTSVNPIEIAGSIMNNKLVKMHGPEHHFIVPAALASAFDNKKGFENKKNQHLKTIKERTKHVLGGFCGTHGSCGAAMGVGTFFSVITETTPLSTKTWKVSNKATARALLEIADKGGPRCCKRDTYIALLAAIDLLKHELDVTLDIPANIQCNFYSMNRQCLLKNCPFYFNSEE